MKRGVLPATYLLPSQGLESANANTPLLMVHGEKDEVTHIEFGEKTYKKLQKLGLNVKFVTKPNLSHSIYEEELEDITRWIKEQILNR